MKRLAYLFPFLLSAAMICRADEQQPFDPTSIGLHVGYLNGRVAPEADIAVKVGSPVLGFQVFSVTGFAALAAKDQGNRLEATAVTGIAMVRPLGEYVYFGPITQLGVGNDGKNTGMVGKAGGVAGYRFGHSQHWSAELVLTATRSPLGNYMPEAALGVRYGFNAKISLPAAPKVKKYKAPKA